MGMARPDPARRIVTCCYCASRSTLPREGGARLVCHGCGAPIRVVAALEEGPRPVRKGKGSRKARPATPHPALPPGAHGRKDLALRRRKGRRRKSLISRLEDLIEDAVEEIGDLLD
jgi:hypothetical protein